MNLSARFGGHFCRAMAGHQYPIDQLAHHIFGQVASHLDHFIDTYSHGITISAPFAFLNYKFSILDPQFSIAFPL